MSLPSLRRAMALCAALGVVSTACVGQDDPGVGITEVRADLVFGVKEEDAINPTLPGSFAAETPLTSGGQAVADDSPSQEFGAAPPKASLPSRPSAARAPCPPAALNEFPDEPALTNLPMGMVPKAGEYRWKRSGTQQYAELPIPIGVEGFERRVIRNVTIENQGEATESGTNPQGYDATFTYEVVQPSLDGTLDVVTTYQVRTAARSVEADPYGTGIGGDGSNKVVTGEPDRGVSIVRIERVDRKGNPTGEAFEPSSPLLLFPLGVRPGETFTSAGIDPKTGQTGQVQAQVLRQERVDACGEVIEGWRTETTITFGGGDTTRTQTYNFVASTNLGGIVIAEEVKETNAQGTFDMKFSIGQTTPTPPEGA